MIEKRNSLLFSEGVRRHGFSKVDVSDQLIKLRMERFLKGAADALVSPRRRANVGQRDTFVRATSPRDVGLRA